MGTESARVLRGSPSLWLVAIALFGLACSASLAQSQDQTPQPAATQMNSTEAADEALLKAVQNPVADLISVPIQNNINPGIAPYGRVQNVISLQPVIPSEPRRELDAYHPHHPAHRLAAISRPEERRCIWPGRHESKLFPCSEEPRRGDLGSRSGRRDPYRYQPDARPGKAGLWAVGGCARATRPMDGRRVGQQRLVSGGVGWTPSGQSHGFAVFPGLQPAARLVPELVAHDNRRLARHCRQCVDCAIWVGSWEGS